MQEVPADSGNFPWYMTDSIAVLEDSYSEVVMNVIDLALNWQLFSDVGRPRSFVNVMSTNSTLDPERRSDRVKLFFWGGGGGGLIFETNCIFEYKPSPHFRLDVVYKMGGRINGTLRYYMTLAHAFLTCVSCCLLHITVSYLNMCSVDLQVTYLL